MTLRPETAHRPPLASSLLAAARIVAAVRAGQAADAVLGRLSFEQQPAARDLAWKTLRRHGRDDFFLRRLLHQPLASAEAHALLLVALARLEERPPEAHTLVDQAVRAANKLDGGRYKGLTNAVLRNFLRRRGELLAAAEQDPEAHWQHPAWWIARLKRDWPNDWPAILAAGNSHPPMTLRVNRRRSTVAEIMHLLDQAGIEAEPLDEVAIHLPTAVPVARLPGFAEGLVSVQDYGAQQAARLLELADGQRVLDACAAPGGKSAHMLESADVALTALDVAPARTALIRDNLARLGLRATVETADCRQVETWWDGVLFDRILLDAPCSASGVVRRHPDAKWLRRKSDIAAFAQVQATMLVRLWPLLKPGGKMLYCTCSLFAEENAHVLAAFAAKHRDARPIGERVFLPSSRHDGFLYALLEKTPA